MCVCDNFVVKKQEPHMMWGIIAASWHQDTGSIDKKVSSPRRNLTNKIRVKKGSIKKGEYVLHQKHASTASMGGGRISNRKASGKSLACP